MHIVKLSEEIVPLIHKWAATWQNQQCGCAPSKDLDQFGHICPVWSESSLSAWRKLVSLAIHWAHSEDSDQIGWMPRLIWVFAGRTLILLVLSCCSSNEEAFVIYIEFINYMHQRSWWWVFYSSKRKCPYDLQITISKSLIALSRDIYTSWMKDFPFNWETTKLDNYYEHYHQNYCGSLILIKMYPFYMSLVRRIPVFGICHQARLKPACSATKITVLKFCA